MYPFGGILLPMMFYALSAILGSAQECEDQAPWCRKLGSRRVPLSRCYKDKNEKRCCASCKRLRLPITGCPYGDKQSWCSSVGKDRPTADCYVHNQTCCQTCHLFDSGIPNCPFGDGASWCSKIGSRFTTSSCYDHASYCCGTCLQYRRNDPNCMFGDRQMWCSEIGSTYTVAHCDTSSGATSCCETCKKLQSMTPEAATDFIAALGSNTTVGTTPPSAGRSQQQTTEHSTTTANSSSLSPGVSTSTQTHFISSVASTPTSTPIATTFHSPLLLSSSATTTTTTTATTTTKIPQNQQTTTTTTTKSSTIVERTTLFNELLYKVLNNDTTDEGSIQEGEGHLDRENNNNNNRPKSPSVTHGQNSREDIGQVESVTNVDNVPGGFTRGQHQQGTVPSVGGLDSSQQEWKDGSGNIEKENKDTSQDNSEENDVNKDYLGDSVSGDAASLQLSFIHCLSVALLVLTIQRLGTVVESTQWV